MIIELVTDDNNSFKLQSLVYLGGSKNMMILTREEKERRVLDLYNQGKTYREIAKEARISPRDIGTIVRKAEQNHKNQQQSIDNSNGKATEVVDKATQAYKLFSEGKDTIKVAITLGIGEKQTSRFFKEFWTLKHQHELYSLYEEIKNDVPVFLKLHRLLKQHGMKIGNLEWFVNMVLVGAYKIPSLDNEYKELKNDVGKPGI
jgi:DNA-binding CsgD family transcriptional regulator